MSANSESGIALGQYVVDPADGLLCLPSYLTASPEERAAVCNGIGACHGLSRLIPETNWGQNVTEVGNKHDWSYHAGGDSDDRLDADEAFRLNLEIMAGRGCWCLRWLRRRRARMYFDALRLGGFVHFNWHKDPAGGDSHGA